MKINHVGITVPDIDTAVDWYSTTFNLRVLVAAHHASTETAGAERRRDVFGTRWRQMKLAHLVNEEGIGFELFEFIEPNVIQPNDGFEYWCTGISHLAITVDDIEETIEKITSAGGGVSSSIHEVPSGVRICYCSDPWGTTIELVTSPYIDLTT